MRNCLPCHFKHCVRLVYANAAALLARQLQRGGELDAHASTGCNYRTIETFSSVCSCAPVRKHLLLDYRRQTRERQGSCTLATCSAWLLTGKALPCNCWLHKAPCLPWLTARVGSWYKLAVCEASSVHLALPSPHLLPGCSTDRCLANSRSSVALALACLTLVIAAPADARRLLAEDTTNGILPAGTDAFYTAMAELRQSGYTPNTFAATTPALAPTAAKSAAAAPTVWPCQGLASYQVLVPCLYPMLFSNMPVSITDLSALLHAGWGAVFCRHLALMPVYYNCHHIAMLPWHTHLRTSETLSSHRNMLQALTEERSAPLHASAPAAYAPQSAAPAAGLALSPSAVAAPAPGPIPGLSAAENQQLAQLRAQDPIAAELQTQVYKSRAADASAGVTPQSVLAALKPIHDQVQAMVLSEADNPDPYQREHMQLDLIKSAVPAAALVQQAAQPITTVVEKVCHHAVGCPLQYSLLSFLQATCVVIATGVKMAACRAAAWPNISDPESPYRLVAQPMSAVAEQVRRHTKHLLALVFNQQYTTQARKSGCHHCIALQQCCVAAPGLKA